jgi:TonB family protein
MRRLALLLLLGCGGTPAQRAAAPATAPASSSDEVADPETYEDLNAFFARKRPSVGQCYNEAFVNVEQKLRRSGYVTVQLDVLPAGRAENVHVAGSSLGSKEVEACVVALVSRWVLPQPPRRMAFSYSYEFRPE